MAKKIIEVVVAVILVIGISAGTTLLVDKNAIPVSTKIENGLSAYELAVQYGYEGTVQEWLTSLEGKSAYQVAVDSGYSGTESEWLTSLKATADNATNIKDAEFNSKGELILTLSDGTILNLGGAVAKNGAERKDGINGKDGANGISITTANINNDGQLVIGFSNGKTVNLDKVVGMNGKDGVSVTSSKINANGELVLTYSNGQDANLGVVIGAKGDKGDKGDAGANGKDGTAIISTVINNNGELVITYSNNTIENLGIVVGSDGKDGTDGTDGQDGANGIDGKDGISVTGAEITSDGELVLTYSNNQRSNLGKVIGADGKDGQNGTDGKDGQDGKTPYIKNGNWWIGDTDTGVKAEGKDGTNGKDDTDGDTPYIKDGNWWIGETDTGVKAEGVSVVKSEINVKGELVITYSNNQVDNLGVVVGSNGKDGTNGKDGQNGADGKDGIGIKNIEITDANELLITLTNESTLNLGCIKGADGKDGTNGKDGVNGTNGVDGKDGVSVTGASINTANELVLTFSNNTEKNLGVVVGANGEDGQNGTDGKDGRGIKDTEVNALGELVITYTDNTTDNLGVIVSDNGGAGTGIVAPRVQINANTNEWEISTDGGKTYVSTGVKATGKDGANGQDGQNGQDGTDGQNGQDGTDGDTPYIKNGNWWIGETDTGVKAEGVDGTNGTNGSDGKDGIGVGGAEIDENNHLIIKLSNNTIIDVGVVVGTDGKDGTNGTNGKDGVGIKNVTVSDEGILTVTLDNDTVITLGNIKGKDGVGIAKTEINAEGKLVITYTDKKVVTLGKVVGSDGIGIKSAELTDDYMLKLTFTDNGTQTLGPIRGEKGADGKEGVGIKEVSVGNDGYLYVTYTNSVEAQKIAYIKGDKGDSGTDGKTPYILNGTWWIGETNTGVKAEGEDGTNGKDGVGVQNAYINSESHLIIVLTNGVEIDAGYVGGSGSVEPLEKFTVTFKDYDGTVLKTEEVESGKSATAPANPSRTGYTFTGWNQPFNNVISDIVVIAQYQKITTPTLVVSNVTTTAGATNVEVLVDAQNNPGIAGMTLGVEFDDSVLTLTKVSNQDVLSGLSFQKPKTYKSGCNLVWYGTEPDAVMDGTAFKMVFTIADSAQAGTYPIKLTYSTGYDANLGSIEMAVINGSIVVK